MVAAVDLATLKEALKSERTVSALGREFTLQRPSPADALGAQSRHIDRLQKAKGKDDTVDQAAGLVSYAVLMRDAVLLTVQVDEALDDQTADDLIVATGNHMSPLVAAAMDLCGFSVDLAGDPAEDPLD